MAKAPKSSDQLIHLTDEDGEEHAFELLETVKVGKKNFALLLPMKGPKDQVVIVSFTNKAKRTTFTAPSDKEFEGVMRVLEAKVCCGDSCADDCACEEAAPAKKAPAKKAARKSAKKAPARKPARAKPSKKPAGKVARRR